MAMTATAARGAAQSQINVTPMIDVLLVLLIIFMVVQPGLQRGVALQVPPPSQAATPAAAPEMVLQVSPGGRYTLNTRPVGDEGLQAALARVFAGRPRKVLFVAGAEGARYGEVVAAVDASRAAGVEVVGLVPRH